MNQRRIRLLMLLVMFVWGSAFVAVAAALKELSPLSLTGLRFFIAGLVLLPFVRLARPLLDKRGLADLGRFFLLGLFSVVLYHVFLNISETLTTATVASIMATLTPVFTAVLAAIFLGERLGRYRIAGLLTALIGSLLVILGSTADGLSARTIAGPLYAAVPPLAWGVYTILTKPMLERYSTWQITVNGTVAGAILLLPLAAGEFFSEVAGLSLAGWANVFYLSLGATIFGYAAWNHALKFWEASRLAVWTYLIPLFTAVVAVPVLGERLTPVLVLGALIVIAGVQLVERRVK